MNPTEDTQKNLKPVWPDRRTTLRRLLIIAAVLFPCTWIVTALLIGSWNLLGDRNGESFRHLREAGFVFAGAVCVVFLFTLSPTCQRVFGKLFTGRAVRRVLIVLAWLVTIIAVFYGEEDWRGRHGWNRYSETLKAQGDELDLSAFVPKPIPDEENFAATPEIKSWFIENTNLQNGGSRFTNKWEGDDFGLANATVSSSSDKGSRHLTDLVAWQLAFDALRAGTNSTENFSSDKLDRESRAKAAPAVLEDLKFLENRLEEVRAASQRPRSRYPVIYNLDNPWGILLPHLANIQSLIRRLQLRTCAELAAGENDRALDDVKLMLRLGDSLNEEPFLISYLVRAAVLQIAIQPVWEGLAEQRWTDAQLKELQALLERYDFVADLKRSFDGERAAGILTADLLARGTFRLNDLTGDSSSAGSAAANAFGKIMPAGWYDMEKLSYCRLYNLQLDGVFDVHNQRVFAHQIEANSKALEQALAGRNPITTILTRHQLLAAVMLPALGKIPMKGALAQVATDQVVIACGLERYRLAHGQFPDKLDAISSDFIFKLPHDVLSGEPYKYRRTADGQFVLYSVGWNETDDGGQIAMKGNSVDSTNGDWVWQYPSK